MEQIKKFASDISWILIGSVVNLSIGFLLSIFLARWLGVADLGLYRMVITIQGIAGLFTAFGIPGALTKYVAEYKNDINKLSQIITSGITSQLIFGMATSILLCALSGILASIFSMPQLAHLLRILAIAFPFTSLFQSLIGSLNGLREMRTYAYLVISQTALMILFIAILTSLGLGVQGVVFGIVLSMIGGCIGGLYISRRLLSLNFRGYTQNAKRLISFGSLMFGANALSVIATYTDVILIGYFLMAKDIGYYSIAIILSNLLLSLPQAIQMITYPATAEYWSQNNSAALQRVIDKSMKYSACILLPVGLGIGFFAKEIVTLLYGQDFIPAALPLCVLLIARVIRGSTAVPIGGSFSGIGRPDLALKIDAISVGTNVVLNALLIPRFGIMGAAIATTTSLLLGNMIFFALIPRVMKLKIDFKWFAQAIGLAAIAVALFWGGSNFISHYIVGGVILLAYVALVLMRFITREDRDIFKSLVNALISRKVT